MAKLALNMQSISLTGIGGLRNKFFYESNGKYAVSETGTRILSPFLL